MDSDIFGWYDLIGSARVQPDFIVISDSQPSLIDIDSMVPHEYPDDVNVAIGSINLVWDVILSKHKFQIIIVHLKLKPSWNIAVKTSPIEAPRD